VGSDAALGLLPIKKQMDSEQLSSLFFEGQGHRTESMPDSGIELIRHQPMWKLAFPGCATQGL
jgi:hypothetical protein